MSIEGVRVWRNEHPHEGWAIYSDDPRQNPLTLGDPGRWHAEPVAAALVAVAEAAERLSRASTSADHNRLMVELIHALDVLAEAQAGAK